MKKFAALLLLVASCASEPKNTDIARKAFEDWAKAAVAGDAEKTFSMLSDSNLADWLFNRLEENDPLARRWRGELTGRPRTDLDLWWGMSRKRGNGRAEPLASTVLTKAPQIVSSLQEFTQALNEKAGVKPEGVTDEPK